MMHKDFEIRRLDIMLVGTQPFFTGVVEKEVEIDAGCGNQFLEGAAMAHRVRHGQGRESGGHARGEGNGGSDRSFRRSR